MDNQKELKVDLVNFLKRMQKLTEQEFNGVNVHISEWTSVEYIQELIDKVEVSDL